MYSFNSAQKLWQVVLVGIRCGCARQDDWLALAVGSFTISKKRLECLAGCISIGSVKACIFWDLCVLTLRGKLTVGLGYGVALYQLEWIAAVGDSYLGWHTTNITPQFHLTSSLRIYKLLAFLGDDVLLWWPLVEVATSHYSCLHSFRWPLLYSGDSFSLHEKMRRVLSAAIPCRPVNLTIVR